MLSKRVKQLTPYIPGEQPQNRQFIKLNTNENPYPPSPNLRSRLSKLVQSCDQLRLYPDPESVRLRQSIAQFYNITVDEVFVGNGSDEVLSHAFYAFFDPDNGDLLFPQFTYSFYPVYCNLHQIPYRLTPMNKDLQIDIDAIIKSEAGSGLILANPNAPTGQALTLNQIKKLLDNYPKNRVVIIDEAYVDFGSESAISLTSDYPNLLVIQTFSKSRSLAGQRIGFAIGNKPLINALTTTKNSFNSYPIDKITEELAIEAINDKNYFKHSCQKIIDEREKLNLAMKSRGWKVLPSKANFIFAKHPNLKGETLYQNLKERGILVRWFNQELIQDYLRISIGLPEENDQLIIELDKIEQEVGYQS